MKTITNKVSFATAFLCAIFAVAVVFSIPSHAVHAQTSTDTNPCFSVNQSFYTNNGYRAPYSQIYLSDGTTIAIKNQTTPSILENFVYTVGGGTTPTCAADDVLPNISGVQLPIAYTLATEPWSSESQINTGNDVYANNNGVGYMTYHFLPDTSSVLAEIQYTNVVKPNYEDSIINEIDKDHGLTFVGKNGGSEISSFLPMTNCVPLSGTGHIKIVFMRGKSWNIDVDDFMVWANNVVNNGFKNTDPFKSYINDFSFYVDLKQVDETSLSTSWWSTFADKKFYWDSAANIIKSQSSCANISDNDTYYIFNHAMPNIYPGYADANESISFIDHLSSVTDGSTFMDASLSTDLADPTNSYPLTVMHEFGHEFAHLNDEYLYGQSGILGLATWAGGLQASNCTNNPRRDFTGPDGYMYGSVSLVGCSYMYNPVTSLYGTSNIPGIPSMSSLYFRPSDLSLMNEGLLITYKNGSYMSDLTSGVQIPQGHQYSVIDCGYILAVINGKTPVKTNASSYWPECLSMSKTGTVQSDHIPPVSNPPVIGSIIPDTNTGTSNTIDVYGSGFTASGNSVKLTPLEEVSVVSSSTMLPASVYNAFEQVWNFIKSLVPKVHAQTASSFYEIDNVPSSNLSSLTFSVPTTTPDGVYTVSVSALNSTWTDTPYTVTVSGHGAGDSTTAIPAIPILPSVSNSIPAPATYSCPSGMILSSDNAACFKEGSTTQVAATTIPATNYCPDSSRVYSTPNGTVGASSLYSCKGTTGAYYPASQSCPAGDTGPTFTTSWICTVPATTSFTPASITSPAVAYSCPTGFTRSDMMCNPPASTIICPSGYTASGASCVSNPGTTYTVTPTAGAGGSISPPSPVSVAQGSSQTFIVTPAVGYQVDSILLDGVSVDTYDIGSLTNPYTYTLTYLSDSLGVRWSNSGTGKTWGYIGGSTNRTISATFSPVTVIGTPGTSGAPSTVSATSNYSCTSGYTLQSDSTCYKAGGSTTSTSNVSQATITRTCPRGFSPSSQGDFCSYVGGSGFIAYNLSYSCPSGGTVNYGTGWVFESLSGAVRAQYKNYMCTTQTTTTTNSSTIAATISSYSCPAGYTDDTSDHSTCDLNQGPINLNAIALSGTSAGKVTLTWSNNSVLNVQNVEIDRSTTNDPSTFTTLTTLGPTVTTYFDASGAPGTTYYYQVRQIYQNGNYSTASAVASVKTSAASKPVLSLPSASVTTSSVELTWSDNDRGVSLYNILSLPASTTVARLSSTTKTYTVLGLAGSTTYCYAVVAVINSQNTATSLTKCAKTLTPPITINATNTNISNVTFNWSSTLGSATTYTLIETSPASTTLLSNVSQVSFTAAVVPSNTNYCVKVVAKNGTSIATSSLACTRTPPPLPLLHVGSYNDSEVIYSWGSPDPTVTTYTFIQTAPTNGIKDTGNKNFTSDSIPNVVSNTHYCAVVVAINADQIISTSTEVCVTTPSSSMFYGSGGAPIVPPSDTPTVNVNNSSGTYLIPSSGSRNQALPFNYHNLNLADVLKAILNIFQLR